MTEKGHSGIWLNRSQDVDWNAGIRRERRGELARLAWVLVALTGLAVLQYDPAEGRGRGWLLFVGAAGLAFTAFVVGRLVVDGLRHHWRRSRLRFAIRAQLDPGAELLPRAERLARRWATYATAAWWLPLFGALQLPRGRWAEPAAATMGAVIMAAGLLGTGIWQHRLGSAAQRWLDAPPGQPSRPLFSPPPDQRPWTLTPRQGALFGGLVIATVAVLAAAALAVR
jgi:hypothetical protein